MRDELIIAMEISIKKDKKRFTIKLVDSLNLLQSSLDSLCKTFETDVKKLCFPYNFVNKNNLFYIGPRPDISFYNIEFDFDKDSHTDLNLEGKILKLEKDLSCLSDVIEKFKFYLNSPRLN